MRDDGTTQNKPKRLRQPYFNAQTIQTRAHTSPLDLRSWWCSGGNPLTMDGGPRRASQVGADRGLVG